MKQNQRPKHKYLEYKLLPRLQLLGWILIFFGCAALLYCIIALPLEIPESSSASLEIADLTTILTPQLERLLIYLGAGLFWIIGISCVIFARRNKVRR
jgi:hypothetical protein